MEPKASDMLHALHWAAAPACMRYWNTEEVKHEHTDHVDIMPVHESHTCLTCLHASTSTCPHLHCRYLHTHTHTVYKHISCIHTHAHLRMHHAHRCVKGTFQQESWGQRRGRWANDDSSPHGPWKGLGHLLWCALSLLTPILWTLWHLHLCLPHLVSPAPI